MCSNAFIYWVRKSKRKKKTKRRRYELAHRFTNRSLSIPFSSFTYTFKHTIALDIAQRHKTNSVNSGRANGSIFVVFFSVYKQSVELILDFSKLVASESIEIEFIENVFLCLMV